MADQSPESLRVDRSGLLSEDERGLPGDLHLRTEGRRSGAGGGWRDEPGRQRQQIGLDDYRVAVAPLLVAACFPGRPELVHLTTHATTPCRPARHGLLR